MQNAWLLFVNFGGGDKDRKFRNKFSGNGKYMTFTVDPRKELDELFYDYASVGHDLSSSSATNYVLLFVRPASNSEYLFCGNCTCVGEEARSGGIDVLLEMSNFDDLQDTAYMAMVKKPSTDGTVD